MALKPTPCCSAHSPVPTRYRFASTLIGKLFAQRASSWTPTSEASRPGLAWRRGGRGRRAAGRGGGGGASRGVGAPRATGPSPVPAAPAPRVTPINPDIEPLVVGFPDELRPVLQLAVERLVDYQDRAYAEKYLERVRPLVRGGDLELAGIVARYLAVWMTYEDAVVVAQLKTRANRFERIRRDKGVGAGEIVVTDFLKPDLDEIYGVLPYRLVAPFARWAERRWPHGRPTLGQHVKTTTVSGFLRVWMLTWLKPLRPISYRAYEEHARMERWLAAVARCEQWDDGLACEMGRAAQLVKGYGDVRRRMAGHFDRLLEAVLRTAEREAAASGKFEASRSLAARYRTLVLQGPDSEAAAVALAAEASARH